MPADWEPGEVLVTPPLSFAKEGDLSITVDSSRLVVTEDAGPDFGETYRVHDIASAWLRALPHVPYRSLGLNWSVSTPRPDADRWLLEHCAAPRIREVPGVRGMVSAFAVNAGDAVCHIKLLASGQASESEVVADCNVHHPGPLNADEMLEAIKGWEPHQAFVRTTLDALWDEANR